MYLLKRAAIILLLLLSSNIIYCQKADDEISLNLVAFPPSPNAAAIAKFGEIPVSLYTGTPEITIPIFSITTGELATTIQLSYHANGFKVGELASNIGLGWSLTGLGNISRTVRGIPDEAINGYLNSSTDVSSLTPTDEEMLAYLLDINKGRIDLQADLFQFNILGKSGKFFVDKATGRGVLLDAKEKLVIERSETSNWIITDDKGFKYYFGNFPNISANAFERTVVTQSDRITPTTLHFSSNWLLVRVEDTKSGYINFEYGDYTTEYCQFNSASKEIFTAGANCSLNSNSSTYDEYEILGKRISKISWKSGSIEFSYATGNRSDLTSTDTRLSQIVIKNNSSPQKTIAKFNLEHSYFEGASGANGICNVGGPLKLDKVTQLAEDNTQLPPFEFTYNSMVVSNQFSQDYWGFHNNRANTTMVPSVKIPFGSGTLVTQGADRRPDASASQSGLLTSIKYPTGGKTDFFYESNDSFIADFDFEATTSIPMKRYAIVRKSDMNNVPLKKSRFVVNGIQSLPNGQTGATFQLNIRVDGPCSPSLREGGCGGEIQIESVATGSGTYIFEATGQISGIQTREFTLPNGTYDLVMEGFFSKDDLIYDYADLYGPDVDSNYDGRYNKPIGGIRIKKIVSDAGSGKPMLKRYVYRQKDHPDRSSGVLADIPNYISFNTKDADENGTQGCQFTTVYASNKAILSTTQGSHIGYGYVEEYYQNDQASNNNGKTSYTYTTATNYPDEGNNLFPFAPRMSLDMKRGLLTKKSIFSYNGSNYVEIATEENTYELADQRNRKFQWGMIIGCEVQKYNGSCRIATSKFYRDVSLWVWLKQKTTSTKSTASNDFTTQTTTYSYDNQNHLLPTKITSKDSDNRSFGKIIKYPSDYSDNDLDNNTKSMKNELNQLNYPVESIDFIGEQGQENAIRSTIFRYTSGSSSPKWISSVYSRKISEPQQISNPSNFVSYLPINDVNNSLFDLEASYTYLESGRIASENVRSKRSSYIWNESGEYLIAAFDNAIQTDVEALSFLGRC